jgi:hypothetical protein
MMSFTRDSLAALASALVIPLLMIVGTQVGAQESGATKSQPTKSSSTSAEAPVPTDSMSTSKPTAKSSLPDPTHRVPPGYGDLGLTDQQRERVYKIQAEYHPKIQDLHKRLEKLQADRKAECEAVLTPQQKRLLVEHLREQEQKRKTASEARKAVLKAVAKDKMGS